MTGTPNDVEVKELARHAVSVAAPEELPLFSVLAEATLADPIRMLEGHDGVRERLGFGVGEIALLITPFAVLAARDVVQYLTKCALDAGKKSATRFFQRHKRSATPMRLNLTFEQLAELRRIVLDKAEAIGVPKKKAELLADAFAGRAASE